MPSVDKKWAERIRAGDRRVLIGQFKLEALELRRLMLEHARDFHPPWKDFRNFLADVGPSPGPGYRIARASDDLGPYRPDTVAWRRGGAAEKAAPPPVVGPGRPSDWTMISGMEAPTPSGLPTDFAIIRWGQDPGAAKEAGALTAAQDAASGPAGLARMEDLGEDCARELTDLSWFSPSEQHQQAFRLAYLAWRFRVQPKYHGPATPKFLYLYTLIPPMARSKKTLVEAGLWKPLTMAVQQQRDDHPAWKRFNELLPKAAVIVGGFEIYRQYSLTDDIEELSERIETAELRFRTGANAVRPMFAKTA